MSASASGVSLTRYAMLPAHSLGELSYGAGLATVHLIQTSLDSLDGFDTVHQIQHLLIRRRILDHEFDFASGMNRGMDRQECLSYDGTMLYFTESDVRALLPMGEAIRLMQTAFERLAKGEAINQPRRRLILPTGSVLHYMAGGDGPHFGAKIYLGHARPGGHILCLFC